MMRFTSWMTAIAMSLALGSAAAEDAPKERADMAALELQTAVQHPGLAARANSVEETHKHLQHTLNCLVGPDDEAYDTQAGNPCEGQGRGALADYRAAEAATDEAIPEVIEQAKELAAVGTKQDRYIGATAAAHGVSALLEQARQEMNAELAGERP